jgi:cytochrome b6-f complex iron-sulfur subunit
MVKRLDVEFVGQTRREFCQQACHAASLAALGVLLPGCGGSSPTAPTGGGGVPSLPVLNSTISGSAFTLTIDANSPLNTVGNAALVQASGRQFLVARTAQDTFVALTATCTHEACTVTGFSAGTYVCPCHGSRYNTAGAVLSGPAPRNHAQFASAFANGVLTVSV